MHAVAEPFVEKAVHTPPLAQIPMTVTVELTERRQVPEVSGHHLGRARIVIDPHTQRRLLSLDAGTLKTVGEEKVAGIGMPSLYRKIQIQPVFDSGDVEHAGGGHLGNEPSDEHVVALVEIHERSEAARGSQQS